MVVRFTPPPIQRFEARNVNLASPGTAFNASMVLNSRLTSTPLMTVSVLAAARCVSMHILLEEKTK
jgi:hypothetical protein